MRRPAARVILCTDDGSAGFRGLVTEPLRMVLEEPKDVVLACGPGPMLKVWRKKLKHGVPCQISWRNGWMRCGACLVCACKSKKQDGRSLSPRLA